MPLSFRRSYKKHPGADIDRNKRLASKPPPTKRLSVPPNLRSARYPAIIPVALAAFLGLCLFAVLGRGVVRLPWQSAARMTDTFTQATTAFETALSVQIRTAEARRTADAPGGTESAPVPATPSVSPTVQATATVQPVATQPSNPWAAEIPEAACIPADLPQTGRVVEIVDGDTIRVLMDQDGRVHSVNYLGVAAPDISGLKTSYAREAMVRNSELTFRKQVLMVRDITDADGNGTLSRYVLADGVFVNLELVGAGLARASAAPPDTACAAALLEAEVQAKGEGRGMWSGGP